jgi:peptide/nickel transport system substrate-binding protein
MREVKRSGILLSLLLAIFLPAAGCRSKQAEAARGGRLVVSKSAGPKTFNRLLSFDDQTSAVTGCLSGYLLRINRQTQWPEAELATAWQSSPDGRTLTFDLRRGVNFSDGQPFTADDVVFTFELVNDPRINAPAADLFNLDGRRVAVEKLDSHAVRFTFPAAQAAAERLFDGLPMLPKHRLEAAYRAGRFAEAWNLSAAPEQVVGLGPFKLKEYQAGARVILARNEHYWKTDAAGARLPYLDELVFSLDPDRNTQLLKFQAGETDLLSPVTAQEAATLGDLERQGKIKVHDLGPGFVREIFWFNLNDGKNAQGQPLVDPVKLGWFRDVRFRQAVSHALDREAMARLVFGGRAAPQWGFVSAGDKLWHNAQVRQYPLDLSRAKSLLAEAGFRHQEGQPLRDAQGRPVTFTLMTNAGNALREKLSVMIQEDLARLGIKANVAPVESRALLAKINESFDYEACLLAVSAGDADPSTHLNILLSGGANHWWHPGQKNPATAWEARVDELMKQQMSALDPQARRRLFDEAQSILAEQQPFLFLVSRHLIVAARADVGNLRPAPLPDFALWNVEELYRSPST